MNSINWSRKALKQLRKIQPQEARNIYRAAQALESFPDCLNVKKLTNHPYDYRLRVGRYRVLFDHDGAVKIISIEEVRKRDESTY